ncbi:ABC transporter ATP-binding protein [Plantactinospora sp. WMMB334]|uniref:ABC transporter ATP-binding protein n=1 Tax=Plantactinospora sp. WMMB334 TaxID=3404119 RepID=UPI003B924DB0
MGSSSVDSRRAVDRLIDRPLGRLLTASVTNLRRRWRLLRLLPLGGAGAAGTVTGLLLVAAVAPTAQAVAAGAFVASLGRPGAGPFLAAGLLAAAVLAGEAALLGHEVCAAIVGRRIDGRIRRRVRAAAAVPHRIEHLESTDFQADAVRASDSGQDFGRIRSPGTASVGQLLVLSRYLTAMTAAAVLAAYSVMLAVGLLAVALAARIAVSRQWARLAELKDTALGHQQRLGYWTGLAGPAAAKEVRLFGLGSWLVARRTALAVRTNAEHWRGIVGVLRRQWLPGAVLALAAAAALAVPGLDVLRGGLGGDALVRYALAGLVVLGLSQLGPEAFDIEYGVGAAEATERLTTRYAVTAAPRPAPPPATDRPPTVHFEEVGFHYPGQPDRPVLSGLDLLLRPGETLAVVGRNGVGKTTMVKLLAGLYQPTAGRVTVDGRDLAEVDVRAWRRRIAVLFQDFVRYPATVADNVALSAPEAIDDEAGIRAALRDAGADKLVEALPEGLRTSLWGEGDAGVDLSGGQWQRLAIARALFAVAHGRQVLVLDEPTAHLDVRAEASFYRRVVAAVRGSASIVLISHRLSTVRPADRIVLVADGRVVETGGHDELMAVAGTYHDLFTLQAARFAEPDGSGRPPGPNGSGGSAGSGGESEGQERR